jgi:hypothetical protein
MRSGVRRLTCVDVVVGTHGVVIRNDALVTHRLLQTVRRLSDGAHGLALSVQPSTVEQAS